MIVRPFEWLVVLLLTNTGVSILTGTSVAPAPEVILWKGAYYVWAVALLTGALTMGVGLSSVRWLEAPVSYVMHAVPYYRLGMRLLALASIVYGIAIIVNSGKNGLTAGTMTVLFGALCLTRLISLRSRL